MPIYDYVCSNCGQTTEVVHGIEAEGPRFCPACGAEGTLRKMFALPAVVFKGSGWAKKDRSGSSAGGTKARSGADAKSGDGTAPGAGSGTGSSAGGDGGAASGAGRGDAGAGGGSGSSSASDSSSAAPKAGGSATGGG